MRDEHHRPLHWRPPGYHTDVRGEPTNLPTVQGGGEEKRISTTAMVVGTADATRRQRSGGAVGSPGENDADGAHGPGAPRSELKRGIMMQTEPMVRGNHGHKS